LHILDNRNINMLDLKIDGKIFQIETSKVKCETLAVKYTINFK